MAWHSHGDSDINSSIMPKTTSTAGQQKQSNTSSAAGNAASGISSLIGLGKGIAKKVKGSGSASASDTPIGD